MSYNLSIIISSANKHLGLFDDLNDYEGVELKTTNLINLKNVYSRVLRSFEFRFCSKRKYKWYQYSEILDNPNSKCVVVIDTSLAEMDLDFLYKLKDKNIKIYLYLINSINADSPLLKRALKKIEIFHFDKIFSFDSKDCIDYGFEFLGFNYYSKHDLPKKNNIYDAYFIGTIKGGRGQLIQNVFNYFKNHSVKVQFDVRSNNCDFIVEGMNHLTGKWIPYKNVLQSVSNTNCIIEIVQENQIGATLRYFEAVVYNKKLLSNNPHIKDYPYFNDEYMKIFSSPDDIDLDWLRSKDNINYGYNNDFSPINLVNKIKGNI